MKVTIINDDGAIYKDGQAYLKQDLSFVPANVHALQWNESSGWIEYRDNEDGSKLPNEPIAELPSWGNDALTVWQTAYDKEQAAIKSV